MLTSTLKTFLHDDKKNINCTAQNVLYQYTVEGTCELQTVSSDTVMWSPCMQRTLCKHVRMKHKERARSAPTASCHLIQNTRGQLEVSHSSTVSVVLR